jgi:small subunit ribosomal protein S17
MNDQAKLPRTLIGQVISNKMVNTITVRFDRRVLHPLYKKYVRRTFKLLAHVEGEQCRIGDTVAIEECRPISKRKSWRLQRIVERTAEA